MSDRFLLVVLGACLATITRVAEAQTNSPLRVRLVVETNAPYDQIGGAAWRVLLNECQRIWSSENVEVVGNSDKNGADIAIPLVFDDRQLEKYDSSKGAAFGVTIFRGRSRQILVSAPRARAAAHQEHGFGPIVASAGELDSIMGRILGRVVAHEIGHVVLLNAAHGTSGLMRPLVDVRDLRGGDGDKEQFALAPQERARLATLLPNRVRPHALSAGD